MFSIVFYSLFHKFSPQYLLFLSLCFGFSLLLKVKVRLLFFVFFFLINLFILFIYPWLRWVLTAAHGPSPIAASRGYSLLWCAGFSLWWPLTLRSTGSRRVGFSSCSTWALVVAPRLQSTGAAVVAHGPSCSAACGILPDQGSNPCPLQWQADSQPLHHQGSPALTLIIASYLLLLTHVFNVYWN